MGAPAPPCLYRLIVPLKRGRHSPEYSARAVGVSLFWAFTPLIPIQTYLLIGTWLIARKFERFNFNLVIALAWIWVTNAFTMIPTYFVFYVTGQLMLGRWEHFVGYSGFAGQWLAILDNSDGFMQTLRSFTGAITKKQGLALLVGCIPYALGTAWLGYALSLRFARRLAAVRGNKHART